eukprot:RCo017836
MLFYFVLTPVKSCAFFLGPFLSFLFCVAPVHWNRRAHTQSAPYVVSCATLFSVLMISVKCEKAESLPCHFHGFSFRDFLCEGYVFHLYGCTNLKREQPLCIFPVQKK